jgi:hypothetical protein
MADEAPERVEVDEDQVKKFEHELTGLMAEVAAGGYKEELANKGITVPAGFATNDIYTESEGSQGVGAEVFIILAIKYSPLVVVIGKDLWAWAWPKIRDRLDGAARPKQ